MLLEYYVFLSIALLLLTWLCRAASPKLRTNLLYLYGMLSTLGFLLALDWMAGVVFGLIVLELGKVFKAWLDKKQANLAQ